MILVVYLLIGVVFGYCLHYLPAGKAIQPQRIFDSEENDIKAAAKYSLSEEEEKRELEKMKAMYEEFNEIMRYDTQTAYKAVKKGDY